MSAVGQHEYQTPKEELSFPCSVWATSIWTTGKTEMAITMSRKT